jgi:serine/threonine-protein kinase
MGSVWVARHVTLGSPVAVKFMAPALAAVPRFVARFEREARIAANLQSPHVVHVQDYGIDDGRPYLVMELLRGEDLDDRLKRVSRLSLPNATRILMQAGRALGRAHEASLVHRDLKPGNIFLARIEGEEVVKILDFGIAKDIGSRPMTEVTRTGEVLGSPYYMSPEQVQGGDIDHRSDLWSLAVILFRAITGELPFPGDELGPVFAKILTASPPPPTRVASDLPRTIDSFFARALERDRTRRFQSVSEMLDELARITGVPRPAASIPEMEPRAVGEQAPRVPVLGLDATGPVPSDAAPTLSQARPEEVTSRLVHPSDAPTAPLPPRGRAELNEAPLRSSKRASGVPALRATDPSAVTDSGARSAPEESFQLPVTSTRAWLLGAAAAAVLGGSGLVWVASRGDGHARPLRLSPESPPAQQREARETPALEPRLPPSTAMNAPPSAPADRDVDEGGEPAVPAQDGRRAPHSRPVESGAAFEGHKATVAKPTPHVPSAPEAAQPSLNRGPDVPISKDGAGAAPELPFHDLFARRVLAEAAAKAKSCATSTSPTGSGVVKVTFAPNGRVGFAVVVGQPFAATDVGSCVASIFHRAVIPPFSGGPVTQSQSFTIP